MPKKKSWYYSLHLLHLHLNLARSNAFGGGQAGRGPGISPVKNLKFGRKILHSGHFWPWSGEKCDVMLQTELLWVEAGDGIDFIEVSYGTCTFLFQHTVKQWLWAGQLFSSLSSDVSWAVLCKLFSLASATWLWTNHNNASSLLLLYYYYALTRQCQRW